MDSDNEDLAWIKSDSGDGSSDEEFVQNVDFDLERNSSDTELEEEMASEQTDDKQTLSSHTENLLEDLKSFITFEVKRYLLLYLKYLRQDLLDKVQDETKCKVEFKSDDKTIDIEGESAELALQAKSTLLEAIDSLSDPVFMKSDISGRLLHGPKTKGFLKKNSILFLQEDSNGMVIIFCPKEFPFTRLEEELLDKYLYYKILFYHLLEDYPSRPEELSECREDTRLMVKSFKQKFGEILEEKALKYKVRYKFQEESFHEANALHFERNASEKSHDIIWHLLERYVHPLILIRLLLDEESNTFEEHKSDFESYLKDHDVDYEFRDNDFTIAICGEVKDIKKLVENLKYQTNTGFRFLTKTTKAYVTPKFTSRAIASEVKKLYGKDNSDLLNVGFSSYCIKATGKILLREILKFMEVHEAIAKNHGRQFQIDFEPLSLNVHKAPKVKAKKQFRTDHQKKESVKTSQKAPEIINQEKNSQDNEEKKEKVEKVINKTAVKGPRPIKEIAEIPLVHNSLKEYGRCLMQGLEAEAYIEKKQVEMNYETNVEVTWTRVHRKYYAEFNLYDIQDKKCLSMRTVDIQLWLPNPNSNSRSFKWIGKGQIEAYSPETNTLKVYFPGTQAPYACIRRITSGYGVRFLWNGLPFKRMRDAIRGFVGVTKWPQLTNEVSEIFLGKRPDYTPQISSDQLQLSENFNLNQSQKRAVLTALASPVVLLQGPPGTGKTTTSAAIVEAMFRHLPMNPKLRVLVCAPSNVVCDEIAYKLSKITDLKVLRLIGKSREVQSKGLPEDLLLDSHKRLYAGKKQKINHFFLEKEVIKEADVVCCTCISAGDRRLYGTFFDIVLVDEATMATEPQSLIPILKGKGKLILVGDHKQLGPVVKSKSAKDAHFDRSSFERLLEIGIPSLLLDVQYRMHPDISTFPSFTFYSGKINDGVSKNSRSLVEVEPHLPKGLRTFFWHVQGGAELFEENMASYHNEKETQAVVSCVKHFTKVCKLAPERIGVITPYKGQEIKLKESLRDPNLEIKSVDGFQGREKDVIILSCVRTKEMGFLSNERRLNVAITRSRCLLIIIGDANNLRKNEIWGKLLKHYNSHGWIFRGGPGNWEQIKMA